MALKKVHLHCYAAAFVVAAYEKIRRTPRGLRASHLELF
jgi:hypothetical protein